MLLETSNSELAKQVTLSYKPRSKRYLATYPASRQTAQALISCWGLTTDSELTKKKNGQIKEQENSFSAYIQPLESLLPLKEIAQQSSLYYISRFLIPAPLKPLWLLWQAYPFIIKGLKSLANKELDADLLPALGLYNAILTGKFNTALDLAFVLKLCEQINEKVDELKHTHSAHLHYLNQGAIWLDKQGMPTPAKLEQLQKYDHLIVYAGHRIPVDGSIVKGRASIHRSFPLGTPFTRSAQPGDEVFAGEILEKGQLNIRADHSPHHSRYANIVRRISAAQQVQSARLWEDKNLAGAFDPANILLSLVCLLCGRGIIQSLFVLSNKPSQQSEATYQQTLKHALIEASSHGALLNNTEQLERLAKAEVVIFDLTTALTTSTSTAANENTSPHTDFQNAVQALKTSAIHKIILMTADNSDSNIRQMGISKFYRNLSGKEKLNVIQELKYRGKSIVLITDANTNTYKTGKQASDILASVDLLIRLGCSDELDENYEGTKHTKQLILLEKQFAGLTKIHSLAELAQQRAENHHGVTLTSSTALNALSLLTNIPFSLSLFLQKVSDTAITLSSLQTLLKSEPSLASSLNKHPDTRAQL